MDEFVKKQDVIDFYKNGFPTLDEGVHWSRNDIIMNLDNLTVYEYTPWIPTQKQKPSDGQRVLVSLDGEINIAIRDLKEFVEEDEYEWHIENFPCTFEDHDIEAWKPLPEPFMNKCDKCIHCKYDFDEIKAQEVPTDCKLGLRDKYESEKGCKKY